METQLQQIGSLCYFTISELTDKDKAELNKFGYEPSLYEEDDVICVQATDYSNMNLSIVPKDIEYDEYEADNKLSFILPAYPYYMVYAQNCTWNGASGIKLCDSRIKTLYRGYDVSTFFERYAHRKKTAVCREYHHDCPTGHPLYIIGLTEKQYESLTDASWNTMVAFAGRYI